MRLFIDAFSPGVRNASCMMGVAELATAPQSVFESASSSSEGEQTWTVGLISCYTICLGPHAACHGRTGRSNKNHRT